MGDSFPGFKNSKLIGSGLYPAYRGSHSDGALAIKSFSIL
jgi:hypothetical protein